jgi:predicted metal-dependent TIM-barrel fold hydrolase
MKAELNPIEIPNEIIEAVRLIETWAAKQTVRDDWAIGNICCRKGAERLMKEIETLKKQLK